MEGLFIPKMLSRTQREMNVKMFVGFFLKLLRFIQDILRSVPYIETTILFTAIKDWDDCLNRGFAH